MGGLAASHASTSMIASGCSWSSWRPSPTAHLLNLEGEPGDPSRARRPRSPLAGRFARARGCWPGRGRGLLVRVRGLLASAAPPAVPCGHGVPARLVPARLKVSRGASHPRPDLVSIRIIETFVRITPASVQTLQSGDGGGRETGGAALSLEGEQVWAEQGKGAPRQTTVRGGGGRSRRAPGVPRPRSSGAPAARLAARRERAHAAPRCCIGTCTVWLQTLPRSARPSRSAVITAGRAVPSAPPARCGPHAVRPASA
jgi:hypothetical protein